MDLYEKEISRKNIFSGKILKLLVDEVLTPDGKQAEREIIEHNGGAGIVAATKDKELVLVEQYRRPYDEITLEIPAGKLEKNENPFVCANRELKEETGYTAKEILPFGEIYPSPGYTNEVIHLFLAKDLEKGEAMPDEDEFLHIKKIPVSEALSMVYDGKIKDAKTVICILKYALTEGKSI